MKEDMSVKVFFFTIVGLLVIALLASTVYLMSMVFGVFLLIAN